MPRSNGLETSQQHAFTYAEPGAAFASIVDHERRRIAARLHEDFGQCLAVAMLTLDRLSSIDAEDPAACIAQLRKTMEHLDHAWRQAIFSPDVSHDCDMLPAVAGLCKAAERDMRLCCSIQVANNSVGPSEEGRRVLLHGVGELLLNVRKHAGCERVDVCLDAHGSWVEVSVRDHGKQSVAAVVEWRQRGFGLTNLKNELRAVGGDMRVEAANPGRQVRIRVPVQAQWVSGEQA